MRTIKYEGKTYERNLFLFLSEHYPTGINNLPERLKQVHMDISALFPWAHTEEGSEFWVKVSQEWRTPLDQIGQLLTEQSDQWVEEGGKKYERRLHRFLQLYYPTGINTQEALAPIHHIHTDLGYLFMWEESPEGHDHWQSIDDSIGDGNILDNLYLGPTGSQTKPKRKLI